MTTLLLAAVLLAPPQIDDALIVANAGLATVDTIQTVTCLRSGRCYEANPIMAPLANRPAALAAVSLGGRLTSLWLLNRTRERHPKLARGILWGLLGAQVAVVVHNWKVSN